MSTKNRVLEILEQNKGTSISGEKLAGLLNVSRNAVWKAIKELQKEGYGIEAVTNKGYTLSEDNDILSVQGMMPYLSEESLKAADINIFKTLESTNNTAKEMASKGAEHGTVIIADSQSSGRGRYSRSFFSPAGGLYMSIILKANKLSFVNPTAITAFAAVSVCEAIESVTDKKADIKWVNDIFVEGKKVCGILTEAVTDFESGQIDWIVLGLGINVSAKDFPEELKDIAASISPDKPLSGGRNRLAAEIINRIIGDIDTPEETEVFDKYKKRLIKLGEEITVIKNQTEFRAKALDIDSLGHLLVQKTDGEIIALDSGEIRI